jgi:hypothetical protein
VAQFAERIDGGVEGLHEVAGVADEATCEATWRWMPRSRSLVSIVEAVGVDASARAGDNMRVTGAGERRRPRPCVALRAQCEVLFHAAASQSVAARPKTAIHDDRTAPLANDRNGSIVLKNPPERSSRSYC